MYLHTELRTGPDRTTDVPMTVSLRFGSREITDYDFDRSAIASRRLQFLRNTFILSNKYNRRRFCERII